MALGDAPAVAYPRPAVQATPRAKDFAPGVRIDWANQTVEVDAKVVLRAGPLELFACSPRTREHESVVVVSAKPVHIFQAMGLAGLEPGAPLRFDAARDIAYPPTGEPLDLRVRFRDRNETRVIPIEQWMRRVKDKRPPEWIDWVFSGSKSFAGGRFGADADGTVVCVVDFDTALITVGQLRSADNELLWLEANTKRIPPVGTPCTLLIRAAAAFEVTPGGAIRRAGKPMTPGEVAKAVGAGAATGRSRRLILRAGPGVGDDDIRSAVDGLVRVGVDRSAIRVRRASPLRPTPEGASPPG